MVASEKIFLDIVKEINENSCLYFFYLQINSSSKVDFISKKSWYPIKYTPLIEIKTHLLYSRFRFFFTYDENDNIPVFSNPQTLIKSYNVSINAGYNYRKNLENENNDNNTAKLLIYKLHENSHSKFYSGLNNITAPRYLYNYDLKKLDIHYNSNIKYKSGGILKKESRKTEHEGEEGYVIEMLLYGDYKKADILLETFVNLEKICNPKLYSGNNFDELNKILSEIIANDNISRNNIEIDKKNLKMFEKMNIEEEAEEENDNISQKKSRIHFFKHCGNEAKY